MDSSDKVIVLNQFNYTHNQKKALKEIYRVLKLRGEVVLQDSNYTNLKLNLKSLSIEYVENV
ncbi:hypothetical protein Q5M85_06865 [Paraclostridium bifermentans]|nr:hypothetical protein [Paraclostridium bifermentans]